VKEGYKKKEKTLASHGNGKVKIENEYHSIELHIVILLTFKSTGPEKNFAEKTCSDGGEGTLSVGEWKWLGAEEGTRVASNEWYPMIPMEPFMPFSLHEQCRTCATRVQAQLSELPAKVT